MKPENEPALIIGYYLSRFDKGKRGHAPFSWRKCCVAFPCPSLAGVELGDGTIYCRVYFSLVGRVECRPAGLYGALPGLEPTFLYGCTVHPKCADVQGESDFWGILSSYRPHHNHRSALMGGV